MLVLGVLFSVGLAAAVEVSGPEFNFDVYVINPSYSSHGQQQRPQNVRSEIFQGPVLILAPSNEAQTELVAYYADHGLKSVVDYQNFEPLHQLFRKSGPVSGLLISYDAFNGNQFLLTAVSEFILPNGFRVTDIAREVQNKAVPILYVAPRKTFNNQRFVGLNLIARFFFSEFSVDSVPVHVSNNAVQQFHQSYGYQPSHLGFVYYPNQQIRPSQGSQDQREVRKQQNVQK